MNRVSGGELLESDQVWVLAEKGDGLWEKGALWDAVEVAGGEEELAGALGATVERGVKNQFSLNTMTNLF